jgi:serine/threonine kinase 32
LDAKGHVHLTDFNVAICLKERIPSSRSGTSAYLAPEMLIKSKYSYSVDWWALGVTLFCLTYGKFPFFKTSTMSLSTAIKNGAFAFPTPNQIPPKGRSNFQESKLRNSFLKELLTVNISERLGSSDLSERDVRKHKWIADLDLGKILAFDYAADYIPSVFPFNSGVSKL